MNQINFRIKHLQETMSTNEDVKIAAVSGEDEGFAVLAARQTAGKGRQGKQWISPEGNMYLSFLLRPNCPMVDVGFYAFVTALAVCDAVLEFVPNADIQLKWPNDVLVDGKKISGILLESSPAPNGVVEWLVIGAGINVKHSPSTASYPTTSLAEAGKQVVSVQQVVESFLRHFDYWRQALSEKGFVAIRSAWLEKAKKGPLGVHLADKTLFGEFEDLDENGKLILKLADGSKHSIAAGDIFFNERQ